MLLPSDGCLTLGCNSELLLLGFIIQHAHMKKSVDAFGVRVVVINKLQGDEAFSSFLMMNKISVMCVTLDLHSLSQIVTF